MKDEERRGVARVSGAIRITRAMADLLDMVGRGSDAFS